MRGKMADKPFISIIVPVYNVEKYLRECLDSLCKQTLKEMEIILIDDGATDGSGAILDEYAARDDRIRVLHKKNAGVAAARNDGIRLAKGEWLAFVDSDDWLSPDMYEKAYAAVKNTDVDILYFDAVKSFPKREEDWSHFETEFETEERAALDAMQRGVLYFPMTPYPTKVPIAAPWDKLFRASLIKEHGLCYIEELKTLDDMVFNLYALEYAGKIKYIKEALYHYRMVEGSITNAYKKNRPELDRIVFLHLLRFAKERGKDEAFYQAVYARIIKSFAICFRLCFFHKQNRQSFAEKKRRIREVMESEPYREAFDKIEKKHLEGRLRPVLFCARHRLFALMYCLHRGQDLLQKR